MAESKKVFDVSPVKKSGTPSSTSSLISSTHTTAPIDKTQKTEAEPNEDKITVTVKPKETFVPHEKIVAPIEQPAKEITEESNPETAVESTADSPTTTTESTESNVNEPSVPNPTSPANNTEDYNTPAQSPELSTQVPKIFDSTEYQLPIQQRASLGAGMMMIKFVVVFLVLLLIAAIIAVDAGWLDVGISLPFDVI